MCPGGGTADAYGSGPYNRKVVEVQILSRAPRVTQGICSSVGRASALHAEGPRFEPWQIHHNDFRFSGFALYQSLYSGTGRRVPSAEGGLVLRRIPRCPPEVENLFLTDSTETARPATIHKNNLYLAQVAESVYAQD